MMVLKNKALSKASPLVLFAHFLPSNCELNWRIEGKKGEKEGR